MKLNKKLIIPAFALLAGASLVGSISGTIAWYQYSTRANVSYIGTSAGTIGNLQVRLAGGEWGTQISYQDVRTYLSSQNIGQNVEPITPGALAKNDSLKKGSWKELAEASVGDIAPDDANGNEGDFYFDSAADKLYEKGETAWAESSLDKAASAPDVDAANLGDKYFNSTDKKVYEKELKYKDFYLNPQVGRGPYEEWIKASEDNFVTIPLQLRFMEGDEDHLNAEDVYLSKLVIKEDSHNDDVTAHGDISDAVRVHFSAYADGDEENAVNHLVSNKGGTTLTHGKLKLGGGADFDKGYAGDEFGFDDSSFDYINYGGTSGVQNCYGKITDEETGYYYEEGTPANGWDEIPLTYGLEAPSPSNGQNGDFYFKMDVEILYQKNNDMWGVFENAFIGTAAPSIDMANPDNRDYYVQSGGISKLFLRNLPVEETVSPILVGQVENSLRLDKVTNDKKIGTTVATRADDSEPQKYLNVDVTIWVEGWQKFARDDHFTSMWDRDLIGSMFDVGFQFAVQDR